MKKVVVAGGGVLGSQIAYQAAYCGFDVTVWLRSTESVSRTLPKLDRLKETYLAAIDEMEAGGYWCRGLAEQGSFDAETCRAKAAAARGAIKTEIDLAAAVADSDLVIECVAENEDAKLVFYKTLAPLLPADTLLVTNSSTMLPSTFAKMTGRPDKYCSMHFANSIWKNNTAEIMAQPETAKEAFDAIIKFAEDIRMIPLPIMKEKNGYLLNSMLVPFLLSGLDLYVNGISDPASVDKAWKYGTGSPRGPFEIMDVVGMVTVKNIVDQFQKVPKVVSPLLKKMMMPYNFKGMKATLDKMIEEGKTGVAAGEGFYQYVEKGSLIKVGEQ